MTNFEWINIDKIDDNLLKEFDCGNETFNEFLSEKAKKWQTAGEATTYVFIDEAEKQKYEKSNDIKCISRIYGYASINTTGLLYNDSNESGDSKESVKYLSCAEIRMFATDKRLHRHHNPSVKYSDMIFTTLLQNLYEMSTKVIGFQAIYLNANSMGYKLYKDHGFDEITEFLPSTEENKINIEGCIPLLLVINDDAIYNMFAL